MSIVAAILVWAAATAWLAGRGSKRTWLAALFAFPFLCAALFALEPSFGAGGRAYLDVAVIAAALVWAAVALASALIWFAAGRARSP
jgi:hypothetical protein